MVTDLRRTLSEVWLKQLRPQLQRIAAGAYRPYATRLAHSEVLAAAKAAEQAPAPDGDGSVSLPINTDALPAYHGTEWAVTQTQLRAALRRLQEPAEAQESGRVVWVLPSSEMKCTHKYNYGCKFWYARGGGVRVPEAQACAPPLRCSRARLRAGTTSVACCSARSSTCTSWAT